MSIETSFVPVPVRARRDGWTSARQATFLASLAESRCVVSACRSVGMSWQTAYRLRARRDAASFAAAWNAALAPCALPDGFSGRAIGGIARPITYRGRRVGERRRFDNRLAKYILRICVADRYGLASELRRTAPTDFVEALTTPEAELPADLAPYAEDDSGADVARCSLPSAPRPPQIGEQAEPSECSPDASGWAQSSRIPRTRAPPCPETPSAL